MKLIRLIMGRIALILIFILSLWAFLFYLNLEKQVYRLTDKGLQAYANERILDFLTRPSDKTVILDTSGPYSCTIAPLPAGKIPSNTSVVFRNDPDKRFLSERDTPTRLIRLFFNDHTGQYYRIEARTETLHQHQLRMSVLYWIVFLYFALLCIVLFVNYRVIEKNMAPLYRLLRWIDRFDLHKKHSPLDNPTRITEFQKLNTAVTEQFQRTETLYLRQKNFVDNAAHEIQTPLAVSLNRIEQLLQRDDLSEELFVEIAGIQQTLRKLSRLQKDMLRLSRIEHGAYTGRQKIDIGDLIRQAAEDMEDIFADKKIKCSLTEETALQVRIHPSLAELLVTNLLRNAFVHTFPEGNITVCWNRDAFCVQNTGTTALDRERIFERFYRSSTQPGSSGLGLSICQAVCRQYHLDLSYRFENGLHCFLITRFSDLA